MIVINDVSTQWLPTGHDDMEIQIPNDKYCKYDREKEYHDPEKSQWN